MGVNDNDFIQGALNNKDLSKPPWKLDEEIIPLLKYLWAKEIETFNSCASHFGTLSCQTREVDENYKVGRYQCNHPYVDVGIDVDVSELKQKTEALSYMLVEEIHQPYRMVVHKRLLFVHIKAWDESANKPCNFLPGEDYPITLKQLIKENHKFLEKLIT